MELPLVVGVDGSDSSLRAVDWATDEAARHGVPLRLVYASRWERYEAGRPSLTTARPSGHVMAEHIVASGAERARLRNPSLKVSYDVLPEDAVSGLLHAGRESFALVTGSRGRGEVAGMLLGSVGLTVAARAACPVVVVRGGERNVAGGYGRIVVGVGDLTDSSAAVRFAFGEAEARGCALGAVRAWRLPAHGPVDRAPAAEDAVGAHEERALVRLVESTRDAARDHPRVEVQARADEGPAHTVLLAETAEADLIVVGAARRHGRFGLQLGRAAHVLLHYADCPVAVVPQ
ncbi:universal stress protein [Streptomyces sp. NPDC058739]|uniref:universal stress protein n=1 Tax=Streptomyces sp. NPDC058739 TaxID=3346618 RepID=UPI003678529F